MEIIYKSANYEFTLKLEAVIILAVFQLFNSDTAHGLVGNVEATFTVLKQMLALTGLL